MQIPLVSIVIPSYNHQNFIQECIQSIIDQDYQNIELIIIDDGSSDNSVQKIEEMIDACQLRFIKFEFKHRANKGLCATLNEAIQLANGNYISIIASDDIMLPMKTQLQIEYIQAHPQCAGVFSGANVIKEDGTIDVKRPGSDTKYNFKNIILNHYQLFSPSGMYRKEQILSIGGYKEDLILEDWYMFLKLTDNFGYLYALPDTLISYRRHQNNTSNNTHRLHQDRKKILSYFIKHPLYSYSKTALEYTIAIESISFNKFKSLFSLINVCIAHPSFIFRRTTITTIIKFFIPKKILVKRLRGE